MTDLEITSEMIEAGRAIVQGFNPELDDAGEVATQVFRAMISVSPAYRGPAGISG